MGICSGRNRRCWDRNTKFYLYRCPIRQRSLYSEIVDLHVGSLASSSPVDVTSTDRHTVKPWFQGLIPFAFNLPELQDTEYCLLGGRMTYLDQMPGAHLIYDVRGHHISVFVLQERSLPTEVHPKLRGRGIGRSVVDRTIDIFGAGCGLVACRPWPLQFTPTYTRDRKAMKRLRAPSVGRNDAIHKLRTYWSSLGFWPLGESGIYR